MLCRAHQRPDCVLWVYGSVSTCTRTPRMGGSTGRVDSFESFAHRRSEMVDLIDDEILNTIAIVGSPS